MKYFLSLIVLATVLLMAAETKAAPCSCADSRTVQDEFVASPIVVTATLTSIDRHKLLSNYHLMTDTPENVRYETVVDAIDVVEAVIRSA